MGSACSTGAHAAATPSLMGSGSLPLKGQGQGTGTAAALTAGDAHTAYAFEKVGSSSSRLPRLLLWQAQTRLAHAGAYQCCPPCPVWD